MNMKKLLILIIIICTSSCMVPYSTYDYTEPTRYIYYPTYQPTRTIIVKQKHKHKHKHKSNKRHVKVKINKHRKTK